MKFSIPESIGGDLRLLKGPCTATLEKLTLGKSKAGFPKVTAHFIITDTGDGFEATGEEPVVGEKVIETYSLQPQALFSLEATYKEVTGESLTSLRDKSPKGDGEFEVEDFVKLMADVLCGTDWDLILDTQTAPGSTDERTFISAKSFKG